ncbi:MAG: GNAT family N-acetyltransferase [Bacteroidia bacterium]|nr:GNAT family N-acetyltransferase [Bacteroidia bacterium]
MEIQHINNESKGLFKAIDNGKEAGRMTYAWAGDKRFIIDHTEVKSEYSGQGVGKQMVLAAVEYARTQNVKILPLCPFAKAVFAKTPELRDVL